MIIELLVADADGRVRPLTLHVTQAVVRNGAGTPILAVAADYGPQRAQIVARIGDRDFNASLRRLGIFESPGINYLQVQKPAPGARLIAGPTDTKEGDDDGHG